MAKNNITEEERKKIFGEFTWKRTNGDFVDIDDKWEKENIGTIIVPQLKGIKTDGGFSSGKIQWNLKAKDQLLNAFAEIESQGLLGLILTYDGAFVPRVRRNGNTLSNHAYGTAIDLNAKWNWLGNTPAAVGAKGSLRKIAPIFKTHGFHWGGDWTSPKDGMHFEVARIVSYEKDVPPIEDESKPKEPLLVLNDDWRGVIPIEIIGGQSFVSGKRIMEYFGQEWKGSDRQVNAGQTLAGLGFKYTWNHEQKKLYAVKV